MKCQVLFSGKNKKNTSICHLLNILTGVLIVNKHMHANTESLCTIQMQQEKGIIK